MKWHFAAGIIGLSAVVMIAGGQPIIVESAPFSFPVEVSVKTAGGIPRAASGFSYSGPASRAGRVTFTWSFPGQPAGQKGTITVFSLAGRAVKTFTVSANAGSIAWDVLGRNMRGVYIARIICGSDRHNLKLMLCR